MSGSALRWEREPQALLGWCSQLRLCTLESFGGLVDTDRLGVGVWLIVIAELDPHAVRVSKSGQVK